MRLSVGYGRCRLEVLTGESFGPIERRLLVEAGMLCVHRPPTLSVVTDPVSDVVLRPIIDHDEVWVRTGPGSDMASLVQLVAELTQLLMQPDLNDEILIQVVQRQRSCERCWEISAHAHPY